jgi:hypothetical protein
LNNTIKNINYKNEHTQLLLNRFHSTGKINKSYAPSNIIAIMCHKST